MNESSNGTTGSYCSTDNSLYPSIFGVDLAVPQWEAISTAVVLSLIIILTIIGNVLVILSVFTYKPLRIVQNFFIVSLAVADLTVAILVLPFNVAYSILGRWEFGINLCKLWLTCDILCCTSSILNLCAIALDRYWAITDPINYAQKRTVERVLWLIIGVWVLSLLISSPPLIGWNDWPDKFDSTTPCQLTSQQGYVIYSALGSFYIPLLIMTIVYIEIFIATRRRLRERAHASKVNAMALRGESKPKSQPIDSKNKNPPIQLNKNINETETHLVNSTTNIIHDPESISSETNHNEHPNLPDSVANDKNLEKRKKREQKNQNKKVQLVHNDSITDVNPNENSSDSSKSTTKYNNDITGDGEGDNSGESDKTINKIEILLENEKDKKKESNLILGNNALLLKNSKKLRKLRKKRSINLGRRSGGVYQFIEEKQKISLSKERRAARTLGIIMGVFVICWLPFFLMYVILPFCKSCCPTDKFINFITWLGYINSALNPIIYTIFNIEYRRAFKRLLGIKF